MTPGPALVGGRYEIVREIARGGMGTVYEALHTLSRRSVALKVLHPRATRDDASVQRFLREVSAPAHIGHEGIVGVYDAGIDSQNGSVFVAMELLSGSTLRERLAAGGMTRDQVLDFFEQMLEPLAAAHAKGFVHRDLKPENIFVTRAGDGTERVKILDFGIVRGLGEDSVTVAGTAMGTPDYMSPEQARSARDAEAPSDVWAVGVMLYEAMSGRLPFEGPVPSAVLTQVLTTVPVSLGQVMAGFPPRLANLIDRCLAKDADARPRDAGALLLELRAARRGTETPQTAAFAPTTETPSVGRSAVAPSASGPTPPPVGRWQSDMSTPPTRAVDLASFQMPPRPAAPQTPAATPAPWSPASTPQSSPGAQWTPQPHAAAPTPMPTPGLGQPLPRTTGSGGLKWLIAIGIGGVVLLAVLGVAGYVLRDRLFGPGTGQLRVTGTVQGADVYVDGVHHGPASATPVMQLPAGNHQVELRTNNVAVASETVVVAAGQLVDVALSIPERTLTGTLVPGDAQLPRTGELYDSYQVVWSAGVPVHIEARSRQFDTYIILRAPSGAAQQNDDAPRFQHTPTATDAELDFVTVETGTYEILVTSYRPGETGAYELFLRAP